ncbi:hypothetical protein BCV70DRAFT_202271 [Testicularia cyperi]|uniref:PCI domain-containing protein n=1 Tax=Testicularia cyperi TaxID=1882483 RepID=A0A317XIJ9_9BASI|nr:hypothetical protein BCV70DRAFT_202271 [Testicularia cyperi]
MGSLPSGSGDQQVHLSSNDTFDWETYIGPYKGLARSQRLIYLASYCPELRKSCSKAALELIKDTTRDTSTFMALVTIHNTRPDGSLIPAGERIDTDSQWIQTTEARNAADREKLELEMRNYQNNLIKESIRMAHRDLGDHFKSTGEYAEALKSYTKTRDYCSTTEHVIEMCINVIEVSLRMENWSNVQTFVSKAEGVLESYVPSNSAGTRKLGSIGASGIVPQSKGGTTPGADAIGALFRAGGSSSAAASEGNQSMARLMRGSSGSAEGEASGSAQGSAKQLVAETGAKLKAASALAYMGQARYESAARLLVQLDPAFATSLGDVVSPNDVSIYVALCSMATMERGTLKSQILDNTGYRSFLEHEPHAREVLEAFSTAQFERMGTILDQHRSRHLLDPYLAPHVSTLRTALTRRALRQFFTPFDRIGIGRMATAFGWPAERMTEELVACIQRGEFRNLPGKAADKGDARINRLDNVLEYHAIDARQDLFDSAIHMGRLRCKDDRRLLLRMKLVEHGVVARASGAEP